MHKMTSRIIGLEVNDHAGVLYHITGLFSRRAFNLEGVLCGQLGNGSTSRMYLLVKNDESLEQIIKQLQKLQDVLEVSIHDDYDQTLFNKIHDLIQIN